MSREAVALTIAAATTPVSLASLAVAVVALIVSVTLGISNRRTAKRSLRVSEQQEERRLPQLVVTHQRSFSKHRVSKKDRVLGFQMLITNPTDRGTAIVAAELHLTYAARGVVSTVKLRHDDSLVRGADRPFTMPVQLGANDAVSNWLLFRVDDELTGGRPIDRYEVFVRDVHDLTEGVHVTLIPEVEDEEEEG